ncbi:MAG: HD domain-containing protein [Candidatus Uhrbacteria bacterium]
MSKKDFKANFHILTFRTRLKKCFGEALWLRVFLADPHHGILHGNRVRKGCLKLMQKMEVAELSKLKKEGQKIDSKNPLASAIEAVEIAALFHDCGRFNDAGEVKFEEQGKHHELSAARTKVFCQHFGFLKALPFVEEAVLCHDFNSQKTTPHLKPPKSMIGKLVQASDQIGWFHPGSVQRTLAYNINLKIPFFDPTFDLTTRLNWKIHVQSLDAITVLMHQLFGSCKADRFGVKAAREKIETYKEQLEKKILQAAHKHGVKKEIQELIEDFRRQEKN